MQRDPSGVAFKAVISGAMHFDFTDIALVAPLATTMLGVVGVGGRDVHDILSASVLRFLRQFNHPRARRTPPRRPRTSSSDSAPGLLSHTPVANVAPAERWGIQIQAGTDSGTTVPTGTPPPRGDGERAGYR